LAGTNYRAITLVFIAVLIQSVVSIRYRHPCNSDDHCERHYSPEYYCEPGEGCIHKLTFPFRDDASRPWFISGLVLIVVISALSNAGGIGGGAMFAPVIIWWFEFTVEEAGPITKATLFSSIVVNLAVLIWKSHPDKENETLIDFGLSSILFPILVAGTMAGVVLNKVLPPIATLVLPVLFLWRTTFLLYFTATEKYDERINLLSESPKPSHSPPSPGTKKYEINLAISITSPVYYSINIFDSEEVDADSKKMSHRRYPQLSHSVFLESLDLINPKPVSFMTENKPFSPRSIAVDVLIMVFGAATVWICALLRGVKGSRSIIGINTCSAESWLLFALAQILCFLFAAISYRRHNKRLIGGSNIEQNKARLKNLFMWTYIAGVVSTFLGIGSGLVLSPVMIGLDFIPEIAASISAFSGLFSSSTTSFQFYINGALTLKGATMFMVASAIGSLIGVLLLYIIVQKYHKTKFLIWSVFGMSLVSSVALPLTALFSIYYRGGYLALDYPC
jgi:uncharacterized membrane protein YfcA